MEWRERAACAGDDDFLAEGEAGPSVDRARLVCAGCPVTADCLWWALSRREPFGVWAGTTPSEREEALRGSGIPWVRTPTVEDMVPELALADRLDAAWAATAAGSRWEARYRIARELHIRPGSLAERYAQFATRLSGADPRPVRDRMMRGVR